MKKGKEEKNENSFTFIRKSVSDEKANLSSITKVYEFGTYIIALYNFLRQIPLFFYVGKK